MTPKANGARGEAFRIGKSSWQPSFGFLVGTREFPNSTGARNTETMKGELDGFTEGEPFFDLRRLQTIRAANN